MTSPTVKYIADGHKYHRLDDLQDTSRDLIPPAPYGDREDAVQSKSDANLLEASDLRASPRPTFPVGQASPVLGFEGHLLPPTSSIRAAPISPSGEVSARRDIRGFCASKWQKHKGPIFVFCAQLFGALMNLFARLLELGDADSRLHPMQLLFWRMLITSLACSVYIVWQKIPYGLSGNPKVRWLLVARGFSGFFGIYGVWYSIKYLPLAEATVITFLAPNLAGYLCHIFLKDPYTRTEQIASLLALGGVVLITKPASLFSSAVNEGGDVQTALEAIGNATTTATQGSDTTGSGVVETYTPTTAERLVAIGVALLGVIGTSFAFTTLRAIGQRTHALTSVNYFSSFCVIISFSVLSLAPYLDIEQPDLRLAFPSSAHQWGFLLLTTACGLAVQVLITKGLAAERSNRATAMTYTHMLFAAGFDRFVWGTTMGWMSLTGCGMIITGAVWVAVGKAEAKKVTVSQEEGDTRIEGIPMLERELEDREDDIV
ncbi:hypothetical protein F5Y07DRAFT_373195 [Xylaria sp. FL0933]|nr:hypothetical protein F5Y07DRAFT_373195 [Xylaria sp. FL0933]